MHTHIYNSHSCYDHVIFIQPIASTAAGEISAGGVDAPDAPGACGQDREPLNNKVQHTPNTLTATTIM